MTDLGKLYQQAILQHDREPRHAARLGAPTHAADANNPLCGDRVSITLRVEGERLLEVGCEVKGCAICRASGSMLAEAVLGAELGEVRSLCRRFLEALAAAPAGADVDTDANWGPLSALLEARRFPNRRRCATLSWEALERALTG
jgi:nitrogen fixation NifU-like protein